MDMVKVIFHQEELGDWTFRKVDKNPQILHSDTTCDKKLEQEWWLNPQKSCDFSRNKNVARDSARDSAGWSPSRVVKGRMCGPRIES